MELLKGEGTIAVSPAQVTLLAVPSDLRVGGDLERCAALSPSLLSFFSREKEELRRRRALLYSSAYSYYPIYVLVLVPDEPLWRPLARQRQWDLAAKEVRRLLSGPDVHSVAVGNFSYSGVGLDERNAFLDAAIPADWRVFCYDFSRGDR